LVELKLAVQTLLVPGETMDVKFANVRDYGFDAIEIAIGPSNELGEHLAELKAASAITGLPIAAICTHPIHDPLQPDKTERTKRFAALTDLLAQANELGARSVVSVPLRPARGFASYAEQQEIVGALIDEAAEEIGAWAATLPAGNAALFIEPLNRAVQMIPGIVLVVPLIGTLRRVHLTDSLIGLILTYLLIGLPIATWMLKGYLDDIPRDLDEAALVDGASSTQVLRQILLPLMAPASVAVGAFVFLLSWGEYLFAVSLITSTDKKTLPLALQGAFGQYSVDWGMLLAGGAIICLPPALLFIFFQRFLVGGLTAGGVKG
jgi:hypothetical protein